MAQTVVPAPPGWWYVSRVTEADGAKTGEASWSPIVAWVVDPEADLLAVTVEPDLGWADQRGENRFVYRVEGPWLGARQADGGFDGEWPFPDPPPE